MIDRNHDLSITRQARALGISRGSVYYLPRAVSTTDLALVRRIDEPHLDYPFAGSRMPQGLLKAEGHAAGRLHVSTLMRRMGIEAIYRRPNTSKPAPGHKVFPYLLRKLPVTRPNQVWAMDIIPAFAGTGSTFPWRGALSIWRWSWTGSAARLWRRAESAPPARREFPLRWAPISASKRLRRLLLATASQRSSTPIREASSPARILPVCCSRTASGSAWMAKALGGIRVSVYRER